MALAANAAHAILLIISLIILQPAAATEFDGSITMSMSIGDIDDSGDNFHAGNGDPATIPPIHVFDFDASNARLSAVDWDVWFKGRCSYSFHARGPPSLTA